MSKSNTENTKRWRITRRGFLIGAGAAAGSVALGVAFGLPVLRIKVAGMLENATIPSNAPKEPSAWFEILADSRIRLFVTKAEMGQGVHTALAQFAAEELEIGLADLEVTQASTEQGFRDSTGTSGSGSVSGMSEPLRQAAATLRGRGWERGRVRQREEENRNRQLLGSREVVRVRAPCLSRPLHERHARP